MKSEKLRFYIQVRFKLGITLNEIHKELKTALPDNTLSISTVTRWFNKFRRDMEDLKDQHRPGRPITETTPANIERDRDVIEDNPRCSYDEIEAETSLSRGTIHTIIHTHLNMGKLSSRWVSHKLTEKTEKTVFECVKKIWLNLKRASGD